MKKLQNVIRFALYYSTLLLLTLLATQPNAEAANPTFGTVPSSPPTLLSANFECSDPLRLTPWTIHNLVGNPEVRYARERHTSGCDSTSWVEHLEGADALTIRSEDIETPPNPGKPFDIAFSQPFTVSPGLDYSVSGWMVSFCGGTADPTDCPQGNYIAKMVGMDATGGSDPLSTEIAWVEDRRNFIEDKVPVRWVNLRTAVRAESVTMTVFARINSPFQWHGNHTYLDAISVVRAPIARFNFAPLPITGNAITLTWNSEQSPDISNIPNGAYQLLVDIESRQRPNGEWKTVITDSVGINLLAHQVKCVNSTYEFRIRARSEQSPAVGVGVFPNHRYPGVWSEPLAVNFAAAMTVITTPMITSTTTIMSETLPLAGDFQVFLPVVSRQEVCLE